MGRASTHDMSAEPTEWGAEKVVPRKGLEPPLPLGKRILSHSEEHSPSDDVRLVNSFISDGKLDCVWAQFYEDYLGQFLNTISTLLLEQETVELERVLGKAGIL